MMSLAQSAAAQFPGLVRPSATSGPSDPAMAIAPSMAAATGAGIRTSTGRANAAATPTAVPPDGEGDRRRQDHRPGHAVAAQPGHRLDHGHRGGAPRDQ